MTALAVPLVTSRPAIRRLPIPDPLATAAFSLYLSLGAYLAFVLHAYYGDAYSRVANAYYVLFSRDPHLAAIGFVWMPLPSVFEMALLPFKFVFPAIADQGFAAVIMSAFFMALAVAVMNGTLSDLGLRRPLRLALVGAFALHPMVVYYGANGASEAPTIFFALLACRQLIRYIQGGSTLSLVGVAVALAAGYLTRYETAAAAAGVAGLILVLSMIRVHGPLRTRLVHAAADIAVALTPFVLVFVGWAFVSWMIVGSPFSQFTSEYGNASQMRLGAAYAGSEIGLPLQPSIVLAALRLTMLSVAAPLGVLGALWLLGVRRDLRVLAVGAVFGPMLGFMALAYVLHLTSPWLRYFILVVPFGVLLMGCLLAPREQGSTAEAVPPRRGPRIGHRLTGRVATALVLSVAFISMPVAAMGMLDGTVAREESKDLGALLGARAASPDRSGSQLHTFAAEAGIARYVDSMGLPRGSVLVDAFLGFPIVMQSRYPDLFVITPDRDFRQTLADPLTFGVRYVLAPGGGGSGSLDAINRTYPDLASDRGFAEVVQFFPAVGGSPTWTLYRLKGEVPPKA
jgi:hypothetical protein